MNNNRRRALQKILTLPYLISPSIVLATDYSLKNNPEQKKYIYNPFEGASHQENAGVISNNILPSEQVPKNFWDLPRTLYLKRGETGENARIVYFNNGVINESGYRLACYLLRDVRQNEVKNIDLRLLDLLCAMQAWLIYFGFKDPIIINSGFRTKKTNSSLEGSAKDSMHLYGKAVDFKVPGFSAVNLAKIASQFKVGGIGIYLNSNFIHLDTGGVRLWVRK